MDETTGPKPFLSSQAYDTLKWLAQIALPALGTLYTTLSGIWGLPFMAQVVGTIMALDFFLGATLKLNSDRYYASDDRFSGTVDVDHESGKGVFHIEDTDDLHTKDEVVFKVNRQKKHK